MEPDQPEAPRQQRSPARFQFTLRTMLIGTTVAAVALSGVFAGPDSLAAWTVAVLSLSVPMVLIVALIYGRGYKRTFCIGALFPASWSALVGTLFLIDPPYYEPPYYMNSLEPRLYLGLYMLVACFVIVAFGLLAMGVRWMVERAEPQQ